VKLRIRQLLLVLCALPLLAAAAEQDTNPDPWESVNRKIFAFNDFTDRYFLKPVAKGYDKVTPQFLEDGVHNMFSNLGEVGDILNSLLQGKFKNSASAGGRLVLNSTVGLLGFFDVASKVGLASHEEDFGQTLAHWGVKSGPYVVLPFLGPRTVRDSFGNIADVYIDPLPHVVQYVPTRNQLYGLRIVDTRAQLLKAEELISGDRYIFMRDAYLQRRQFLINDGAVQDTFGNDEDFDYDEGQ
jgi:phospholipid-binding lipoprotein MlaA